MSTSEKPPPPLASWQIFILAPRHHVKTIKTALENRNLYDKGTRIMSTPGQDGRMLIPTQLPLPSPDVYEDGHVIGAADRAAFSKSWFLEQIEELDDISYVVHRSRGEEAAAKSRRRSPLLDALHKALATLDDKLLELANVSVDELTQEFPTSYCKYGNMLLLPEKSLSSRAWTRLLVARDIDSSDLDPFWEPFAEELNVTHIAINSPIPLHRKDMAAINQGTDAKAGEDEQEENTFRSPVDLIPLYGEFRKARGSRSTGTRLDFENAFWAHTTQNEIYQEWAPLYTMFSRGNVREKHRLLHLPSVTSLAREGTDSTEEYAAADLYAGIGYFAFSYKKAGLKQVFCWEVNPWSVEGLRRGCLRNKWTPRVIEVFGPESGTAHPHPHPHKHASDAAASQPQLDADVKDVDFVIFPHSNEHAVTDIGRLHWGRDEMTKFKIRHVNCGFLPSSEKVWDTAVRLLDRRKGGWIHAHENVHVDDVEDRKAEVVKEMKKYVDAYEEEVAEKGEQQGQRNVSCDETVWVKTYAPDVWHIVFDVHVQGLEDVQGE